MVAISNIQKGEQLCLCYINLEDRLKSVEERRRKLLQYGFLCSCPACIDELEERKLIRAREILSTLTTSKAAERVGLCLEMDDILESIGGKIVWRINNLENGFATYGELNNAQKLPNHAADTIGKQLISLKTLLYGKSLEL